MTAVNEFCCDKFKEGVSEGIFLFYSDDNQYVIDWYDLEGDYPVNFCPNCGKKL